jgi:hypothetical protein
LIPCPVYVRTDEQPFVRAIGSLEIAGSARRPTWILLPHPHDLSDISNQCPGLASLDRFVEAFPRSPNEPL